MENCVETVFCYLGIVSRDSIVETCVFFHGVLTTFVLVMLWMPFVVTGSPNLTPSKPLYVGIWLTTRAIAYACMFALIHSYHVRIEREPTETSEEYASFRDHRPANRFWNTAYQRLMEAKTYFSVLVAMAMYDFVLTRLNNCGAG